MKKLFTIIILIIFIYFNALGQKSVTLEIYKKGKVVNTINLTDIDSIKFTPCYTNCGTVRDYDGNVYNTVIIGTQCWMQRNLNATHYRNGVEIPNVKDSLEWDNLVTGAYCNYNNDTNIAKIYGRMYNGYAVENSNKLCPEGWHVPTKGEFDMLLQFLGDSSVAGGKLKEAGTAHWFPPNVGATNSSGFTGLPGGYRDFISLSFEGLGDVTAFWSQTEEDVFDLWGIYLNFIDTTSGFGWEDRTTGFSVRCVKNN
jgi:uncharacterized protein (TIGR02145 family)